MTLFQISFPLNDYDVELLVLIVPFTNKSFCLQLPSDPITLSPIQSWKSGLLLFLWWHNVLCSQESKQSRDIGCSGCRCAKLRLIKRNVSCSKVHPTILHIITRVYVLDSQLIKPDKIEDEEKKSIRNSKYSSSAFYKHSGKRGKKRKVSTD